MNLPLRRRHRRAFVVLVLALPSLYVVAIASRRAVPASNAIVETVDRVGRLDGRWREVETAFDGAAIAVRTWSDGAVLELLPERDPARPDVLVYWTDGDADAPGGGARLLGTLAGAEPRRFALPDAARRRAGRLLLWSLGHGELVASAPLPATGSAGSEPSEAGR